MKPCRQLGHAGCQPSSRFAHAFDDPRICVIMETLTSPAASRPSHTGTRRGGFAPAACATPAAPATKTRMMPPCLVPPARCGPLAL